MTCSSLRDPNLTLQTFCSVCVVMKAQPGSHSYICPHDEHYFTATFLEFKGILRWRFQSILQGFDPLIALRIYEFFNPGFNSRRMVRTACTQRRDCLLYTSRCV